MHSCAPSEDGTAKSALPTPVSPRAAAERAANGGAFWREAFLVSSSHSPERTGYPVVSGVNQSWPGKDTRAPGRALPFLLFKVGIQSTLEFRPAPSFFVSKRGACGDHHDGSTTKNQRFNSSETAVMATQAQMPPAASAVSREGMFSAVTAVPEMLRGILSPGAAVPTPNVSLHRLTLSFWEKDARCSPLEVAFQRRQGVWSYVPSDINGQDAPIEPMHSPSTPPPYPSLASTQPSATTCLSVF